MPPHTALCPNPKPMPSAGHRLSFNKTQPRPHQLDLLSQPVSPRNAHQVHVLLVCALAHILQQLRVASNRTHVDSRHLHHINVVSRVATHLLQGHAFTRC